MPLYDYQCRSCHEVTEVRHGFKETFDGACPKCGSSDMARVFNPAGIVFKGSGFYITDSRKGGGESAAAPAAPSSDGGAKKSESAA